MFIPKTIPQIIPEDILSHFLNNIFKYLITINLKVKNKNKLTIKKHTQITIKHIHWKEKKFLMLVRTGVILITAGRQLLPEK